MNGPAVVRVTLLAASLLIVSVATSYAAPAAACVSTSGTVTNMGSDGSECTAESDGKDGSKSTANATGDGSVANAEDSDGGQSTSTASKGAEADAAVDVGTCT